MRQKPSGRGLNRNTKVEISNGAKIYKLSPFGDEIYLENEREEAITLTEDELFKIVDEFFQEQL